MMLIHESYVLQMRIKMNAQYPKFNHERTLSFVNVVLCSHPERLKKRMLAWKLQTSALTIRHIDTNYFLTGRGRR